jgi:hypothetical protein
MKSKIVIGLFVVTIVIVLVIFVNNEKTKRTSLSRLLEQTVSKSADLYIEQNYRNTEFF